LYILSFSFLYSLIARMAACHIARTADTQDRNCHRLKPKGSKTPKHFFIKFTVVIEGPRLAPNSLWTFLCVTLWIWVRRRKFCKLSAPSGSHSHDAVTLEFSQRSGAS
jgi:hypothetical protein